MLGDPLLQGFILGFVGFPLLLICPSSHMATCYNCYNKGTWKVLQDSRGPGVIGGCHLCWCREMEKSSVQGKTPWKVGYCRPPAWVTLNMQAWRKGPGWVVLHCRELGNLHPWVPLGAKQHWTSWGTAQDKLHQTQLERGTNTARPDSWRFICHLSGYGLTLASS